MGPEGEAVDDDETNAGAHIRETDIPVQLTGAETTEQPGQESKYSSLPFLG